MCSLHPTKSTFMQANDSYVVTNNIFWVVDWWTFVDMLVLNLELQLSGD